MGIKRRAISTYRSILSWVERLIGAKRVSRAYRSLTFTGVVGLIYVLALLILSSGIINALLEGTNPNLAGQIIVPNLRVQNLIETVLNVFTIAIGVAGIYLIHLSGRQAVRRRLGNLYLILGIVVLAMGVLISIYIVGAKGGMI